MIGNIPPRWPEVSAALLGTKLFLEDVLKDMNLSMLETFTPFMDYLEAEVFCCAGCGLWLDSLDEVQEDFCKECSDE